jgi:hypothetical protein
VALVTTPHEATLESSWSRVWIPPEGQRRGMRILHVAPLADQRWVLTLDDDGAPPISFHTSREEAETAARAYADTFGYPEVDVHHVNGDLTRMLLDFTPQPPYPGAAKGAPAAE